jgi:hypothetical protein
MYRMENRNLVKGNVDAMAEAINALWKDLRATEMGNRKAMGA